MLIYEKDNKLNISFENNMEETDIEIGKDEVKIGEATISDNNVLPVPEEGDTGKVPTVQEDGSYALANAGGGSSIVILNATAGAFDTSTSYNDILAAIQAGKIVAILNKKNAYNTQMHYLFRMSTEDGYAVDFDGGDITYTAETADGALTIL